MENIFHSPSEKKLKTIQVSDIMSHSPITVDEEISLQSAAHLLTKFRISGLPVVDVNGQLRGVITVADLFEVLKKILTDIDAKKDPGEKWNIRVKDVMSQQLFLIGGHQSLYEAAKIMGEKNIYTLPVVRDGKIIGVIGRRDIIHAIYNF